MDDTEPEQMSPNEEDEPLDDTRTKNIKLPKAVDLFTETPHETGYHKSTRTCLQYIREAMLHHQWKEASEYMSSYAQSLEDIASGDVPPLMNEVYWRVGTEILHHHHQHPNSMMDAQNSFYAQMKNVGVKGYLLISLEHAFHLLVNGQIMEAHQQLSIAECWRHGKISQAQHQRIRLIQAYKGMLDYIIWCDRKSQLAVSEESGLEADPELHLYFRKASVSLMGILNFPGIWDPFILCYVDMLEFYSDLEGAEKVLTDYAYDSTFPPNPNACIYLYQFLKRHDRPENRMNVLKTLHTQVPSHELMLEYSTLLLQSDIEGCVQTALEVVLDMLDYACWKSSLAVWSHLKTTISRLKHQNGTEFQSVVSGTMATRKDWWPSYHFTSFHAQNDYAENLELMKVKSLLERKLCPGHSSYDSAMRKIYPDVSPQKKKLKRSKNDPKE